MSNRETERYGRVVVFLNFAYLRIVHVASMNTVYSLSMYGYFKVIASVKPNDTAGLCVLNLRIVYVTSMDTVYSLSVYGYFKVIASVKPNGTAGLCDLKFRIFTHYICN